MEAGAGLVGLGEEGGGTGVDGRGRGPGGWFGVMVLLYRAG